MTRQSPAPLYGSPWPQLLAQAQLGAGFRACLCSLRGDGGALPGEPGEFAAAEALSPAEREAILRLQGPPRRREEWLAGRLAAKDAVRMHLRDVLGTDVAPAALEILSDAHGRPIAGGDALLELGCGIHVSISHSQGTAAAVACASAGLCGVGADIEYVTGNHDGLAELALADQERPLLALAPHSAEREWLIRLWCAKEAVAKALGRGMLGGPWNLIARSLDLRSGQVEMEVAGALAAAMPQYTGLRFPVHTGRAGDLAYASAVAPAVGARPH